MKLRVAQNWISEQRTAPEGGSVLIIVLWVSLGLVTLALYFANSMSFEIRAAENRVASMQAEEAIAGAARYISNILVNAQPPNMLPATNSYSYAAVPLGDARFWLIGRSDGQDLPTTAHFGLVDEASKLNLNTATPNMLQMLPRMTPELAAAIIDWRDADDTVTPGGAESQIYAQLNPPYRCKNANFESIDELRLVYGAYLDVLYGEDTNLNGILDLNENDGEVSPPSDNLDGRLDPGLFEYVTVYTREPTTTTNGTARVNVGAANMQQQLASVLQNKLGNADRANAILRQLGGGAPGGGRGGGGGRTPTPTPTTIGSVLELYIRSGMTATEFALIEDDVMNPNVNGLVNVNTASEAVLACIPGLDADKATSLVGYRRSQAGILSSIAWVKDVLDPNSANQAGSYLTGKSYQFTADIAAVGHYGRGYRRVKFIFDSSESTPKILYRQDLTHLGWALGRQTREVLLLTANSLR